MALMLKFGPRPHWWEASALRPQLMPCLLVFRFFIFFYKFNCTDPGLQLRDRAPLIGLLLWTC